MTETPDIPSEQDDGVPRHPDLEPVPNDTDNDDQPDTEDVT